MALTVQDTTKQMARCLLDLVLLTAENLKMMDVTKEFDPIQFLGKGSYGEVLLAKHKKSGKTVALKMLAKNRSRQENFLLEFATSLCLTSHPSIIDTFAVAFETISHFVFVQEAVPAGTLRSIIHPEVGLEEDIVKRCVSQIARALDFMHRNSLVHRDVKPDNILLMDSECHCIKLADFGLTQLQGMKVAALSWVIPFMAPELCILEQNELLILHPSLDVWAFGVLIYNSLTGCVPWNGAIANDQKYMAFVRWQSKNENSPVPTVWGQLTPESQKIVRQMLAIDPTERCSAMDIMGHVNVTWKVHSAENHTEST